MPSLFGRFEASRPFSTQEAWMLFRLAALSEAGGWTLLILGILCKRYITPGNNIPVLLAGQVHGIIFLSYIVAAVGLYPSLRWTRPRAVIAVAASVPPYGSLVFEQWAARADSRSALKRYGRFLVYTAAVNLADQLGQPIAS